MYNYVEQGITVGAKHIGHFNASRRYRIYIWNKTLTLFTAYVQKQTFNFWKKYPHITAFLRIQSCNLVITIHSNMGPSTSINPLPSIAHK